MGITTPNRTIYVHMLMNNCRTAEPKKQLQSMLNTDTDMQGSHTEEDMEKNPLHFFG